MAIPTAVAVKDLLTECIACGLSGAASPYQASYSTLPCLRIIRLSKRTESSALSPARTASTASWMEAGVAARGRSPLISFFPQEANRTVAATARERRKVFFI